MFHANNENQKKTNDGRNRTTKSRKKQKGQKDENLQILGNIGSRLYQKSGDKRKNFFKKSISGERENIAEILSKR